MDLLLLLLKEDSSPGPGQWPPYSTRDAEEVCRRLSQEGNQPLPPEVPYTSYGDRGVHPAFIYGFVQVCLLQTLAILI